MTPPKLTYCGNVHPAEDLAGWRESVTRWSVPVARGLARPFGLGVWWTAATAAKLAHDSSERDRTRDLLVAAGLEIWTLNVFPYAGFHATRVGTSVYEPSWACEERVVYTRDAASAAAELCARGAVLPLSTLPLGYEAPGEVLLDRRKCARNLARIASAFADLEARTGVRAILALEPEPMCALETVAQTVAFLEEWVFRAGAWFTIPESQLRRHLGICVDLCHLAVVGEDPLLAAALCTRHGIEVAKIQVSSALELRDGAEIAALLAFDEPRYLHQTVADTGARALDLAEVARRRAEFADARNVRTHFHMPVFWDSDGPLGSTRSQLVTALRGWPRPLPLLEVETYTWGVLPESSPARSDLVAGLREELRFVSSLLSS